MVKKLGEGKWLIRVYLGRGADGKKKYHKETFYAPLKSMALERERELKRQFQRLGPKTGVSTLGEWLDRWLEETKDTVSMRTWKEYASLIRRLKPFVADLRMFDLNAEQMLSRLHGRLDDLQPRSRKNLYATLKTAVRAAVERKLAPPDALVGFKLPRVPRQDRRTLTKEELLALIKASEGYKYGLVIRLLCLTGARVGEVLGLTWDAVDLEKGTITIERSVDVKKRELKPDVKTFNSRRMVELDPETVRLLREHRQKASGKVTPIQRTGNLVFSVNGRPVRYDAIRRTLRGACRKAGLPPIRIHDIRHSVITVLLSEGVPPILVAALVGHNVATTVSTYAQKIQGGRVIMFSGDPKRDPQKENPKKTGHSEQV